MSRHGEGFGLRGVCVRRVYCVRLATFAPMFAFVAGCSTAPAGQGETAEDVTCVRSQWLGEFPFEGDSVQVSTCIGDECSGTQPVSVLEGSSCLVEDPTPPTGDTPRPEGQGPPLEDVAQRVRSASTATEFAICAVRPPAADPSAPGNVRLEVVVSMLPSEMHSGTSDGAEAATLTVSGTNGENLVETSANIGPRDPESGCVAFTLDLDGNPIPRTLL